MPQRRPAPLTHTQAARHENQHTPHSQRHRLSPHDQQLHPARAHGLTLIELLVVLACVGVLTSLALPSYRNWQQRGQRAQARIVLLQAAHWLERSAAANGAYPAADTLPASLRQTDGLAYRIVPLTTAQAFTLRAEPQGPQADDACGTLTLQHNGERGVQQASLPANICWQR